MRTLLLDVDTNDLVVGTDRNLAFTTGLVDFYAQKITNVLQTFAGEWFLDETIGLPYFETIMKKGADLDDVNAIFQAEILDIDGVEEILKFETNYDESLRKYELEFAVRVVDTEDVVSGEVTI